MAESAYESLPDKDRRLVNKYLSNGMVQWKAYRDVFYSGKYPDYDHVSPLAARKFQDDSVRAAIAERLKAEAMQADEVLYRLTEQGRNDQAQYLNVDGTVDLEGLIRDGKVHLVKGTTWKGKDADRLEVQFYSAQAALKLLAQAHGLLGAKGTEDDPSHVKITLERVGSGDAIDPSNDDD